MTMSSWVYHLGRTCIFEVTIVPFDLIKSNVLYEKEKAGKGLGENYRSGLECEERGLGNEAAISYLNTWENFLQIMRNPVIILKGDFFFNAFI